MSVEDLKKFGQLCEKDESVRARAKQIGINDPDGLMAYAAKELDLEFTRDDMMELAREAGVSKDELSEEDLEKIAGGVATVTAVALGGMVLGTAALGGMILSAAALGAVAGGVGVGAVTAMTAEYW